VTAADFRAAFPLFEDEEEPSVERYIALAAPYFDVGRWGGFYSEGLGNMVAHYLLVAKSDAKLKGADDGGSAVSKTVGSVSITRSGALLERQADDPFMSTPYGRRYRQLSRKVGMGAVAV
jgi:Protein of unknown function (DUF4054)